MIVTIHQPHYLPWLGYLHRMAQADLFVLLDHVQFERHHAACYQNRTRFRMHNRTPAGENCEARWLTVPMMQRSRTERILDKEVDNRFDATSHFATLRHAYRAAGFFSSYAADFKRLFETRWQRLVEINQAGLDLLRDAFGIRTPLVRSSELGVSGAKSELIIDICRAVGADVFLGGLGGTRTYLDAAAFERAGIRVRWQQFQHPVYRQCGAAPFMPGLSAIDLLFNCGPASRNVLLGEAAPQESRAAA